MLNKYFLLKADTLEKLWECFVLFCYSFLFAFWEMSWYAAQVGLKFLSSSDPPASSGTMEVHTTSPDWDNWWNELLDTTRQLCSLFHILKIPLPFHIVQRKLFSGRLTHISFSASKFLQPSFSGFYNLPFCFVPPSLNLNEHR